MSTNDQGLLALSKNPPIDWLLGPVLQNLAARGKSHYLFELLAGKNPSNLETWNAWIAEFRSVVRNPDVAAQKAQEELSNNGLEYIDDFMSEVFTVINLSRTGYTEFEAVLRRKTPTVDFTALSNGKRVRIEVKHLHEPQDLIRTVVAERWKLCRRDNPDRFRFWLSVDYQHHGPLSESAIARLTNAIDCLPDLASDVYPVTLDDGIDVVLKRTTTDPNSSGGLAVSTGYGTEDFKFDLPELQFLYVKVFHAVDDSLRKFFGRQGEPDTINLIVLQWDPPKLMHDAATPKRVQDAIERAFESVGLQLKILIFAQRPRHRPSLCAQ